MYAGLTNRWLVLVWLMSLTLPAQAQTSTPPVIQWQRVIEGGVDFNTTIYAVKSSTGEFGVLAGTTLSRLTASGEVRWSGPVEGSDASSPSMALRTSGLVPTPDGGVIVQANDTANLYLLKKDADGNRVWSKVINLVLLGPPSVPNGTDLIRTADGGYVSFVVSRSEKYAIKLDKDGNFIWSRGLGSSGAPSINGLPPKSNPTYRNLALPDGGFIQIGAFEDLSPGRFASYATMLRLDAQGNRVAGKQYSTVIYRDIIANPDGSGSFILYDQRGGTFTLMLPDGNLTSPPAAFTSSPPPFFHPTPIMVSDGTGQPSFVTLNQGTGRLANSGSDFLLRGHNQQNQEVWTRLLGGSGNDSHQMLLTTGDGYLLVGTTNSTDGDVQGKQGTNLATWVVKMAKTATLFALTQPTYNCQTGAITFNTTGGDGSSITYSAPGIIRASLTSNSGTIEQELRNDPKTINLTATQNGQTVSFTFDFKAFCTGGPPVNPPGPPVGGALALIQPAYNCQTGAITFNTTGGDGSLITYSAPGIIRSSLTSNTGTVEQELRNDPKTINLTATQNGQTVSYAFDFKAFCAGSPPVNPPMPGTLTLTQPTYNCQTGAITFNTTGGDGSTITYSAPGIIRSSLTSNTGTVEQELRNDPQTINLTATQNGQTASFTFDFKAFCAGSPPVNPPTGGPLILLAPTYDCATGAFRFNTSGGDGSLIEYQATPGITGWTTNPNQFVDRESRTANDVKPFTLMARQNGVMVSLVWDLKAACGRGQARQGAGERLSELSISVLGNPAHDAVTVEIGGAQGQPLTLRLVDLGGRLIESRSVEQAGVLERHRFELPQAGAGLLLLRASSGKQTKTVKIINQ